MLINKAFVYKLKPTKKQRHLFRQFAGAVRWVWNHMLDERKTYYNAEKKLAKAQRRLSRKTRGSNRYRKQRQKVARLHECVTDMCKDFLQKLSTRLVTENQGIMVEDFSVNGLARTRLAKSVHDAGWGEFARQLEYKCLWQGKPFHKVDRFFPSTKLHADCGTLNDVSLSDRQFACQGCGGWIDRDLNAARNIKYQGIKTMLAAG